MEWQPIETAPKDGFILLYRPDAPECGMVTIGIWKKDEFAKNPKPYWEMWFKIAGATESRQWLPTHWMQLPESPKE